MILNKYNEIMSNVTVDPEMKSRIMSAVSKAIKDQDNGGAEVTDLTEIESEDIPETDYEPEKSPAPVKKKARRIPIALITSIAAGLLVVLGVVAFFISSYLGRAKAASTTVKEHSDEVAMINDQIDSVIGKDNEVYEATTTANAASETAGDAEGPGQGGSDNRNASINKDKNF